MRYHRAAASLVSLLLLVAGCSWFPPYTITQVSTIDALLAGAFDGQMTCRELLEHGNFGIGTFHALDGEMIVLDGKVYQAKPGGHVEHANLSMTTPFASVVNFFPEITRTVDVPTDMAAIEKLINEAVPNVNIPVAIQVFGSFATVTTRSMAPARKPYPTLVDMAKTQVVTTHTGVAGELVGFRLPPFVKGVNVPGFHLHFISGDRESGGHVLSFSLDSGGVFLSLCQRLLIILPQDPNALRDVDLSRDRSKELEKVEK
jgi:acetolactate decarboxylase